MLRAHSLVAVTTAVVHHELMMPGGSHSQARRNGQVVERTEERHGRKRRERGQITTRTDVRRAREERWSLGWATFVGGGIGLDGP
jgi:hypothetical protein